MSGDGTQRVPLSSAADHEGKSCLHWQRGVAHMIQMIVIAVWVTVSPSQEPTQDSSGFVEPGQSFPGVRAER